MSRATMQSFSLKIDLRPDSGNVQPNAIQAAASSKVERFSIIIPPCQVVRVHGSNDGPQVLPFRRDDPQTTWAGDVEISVPIHLHAVESVFAWRAGHVKKQRAFGERCIRMDFI